MKAVCPIKAITGCVWILALAASEAGADSTLYVNKYFEVREHDASTKYVFDGDARVARITGSLSRNLRVQRLRVRSGWNLLSLAVTVTNALGQFSAGSSAPVVEALYQWLPATSNYTAVNPGDTVAAGSVCWLRSSTNACLSVSGPYPEPGDVTLAAGDHYVASAGLESWVTDLPPPTRAVRQHVGDSWIVRFAFPLGPGTELPITIAPGEAVFIQTDGATRLPVPAAALRVRYYHQDHLGSTSIVSDADGRLVEEETYYPFGQKRTSHYPDTRPEPFGYSQIEQDAESGLHAFPARHYASALARFVQPDPLRANVSASDAATLLIPQKLNPYAYVRNNPATFVDPTGLEDTPAPQERPAPAGPPAASAPPPPSAAALPASPSGSTSPATPIIPDYVRPSAPRTPLPPDVPPKPPALVLTMPAPKFDAYVREPAWQGGSPTTKSGSAGDVLGAVGKVQVNGQSLQDQVTGALVQPLKADWAKATPVEKGVAIGAGTALLGAAAQALRSPQGVAAGQSVMPKIEVPIPLGKGLELKPSIGTIKPEAGISITGRF